MSRLVLAGLAVAGCVAPAMAQQAQTQLERFDRQLEQIYRDTRLKADTDVPVGQRALIDYGGYITFSFVSIDDTNADSHILRQTDLNLYGRVNIDGVHEFFARGKTRYRDWNEGDAFDNHGDDWVEPQLERGFYQFDLARAAAAYNGQTLDYNVRAKVGRQLVTWANGLVLSEELDGARTTFSWDVWELETIVGRTRPSVVDFDSSRPDFDNATRRNFYGGMLGYQLSAKHRPYVYGLVQEDDNDDSGDLVIGGQPVRYGYDSYYIGAGSQGSLSDKLLYRVEAVYQGGEGYSDGLVLPQTQEDIQAWAADIQFDYLVQDANKSRLTFEALYASGDDDRTFSSSDTVGGNTSGTDDNAFNAFGLLNTGLAFAPDASNLIMIRGGASTFPLVGQKHFDRLQIGTNVFGFFKADSDAPIDEATSNSSYLGFETDLYLNYQITSDLALAARYGIFLPGDAITTDSTARHFVFSSLTFAF